MKSKILIIIFGILLLSSTAYSMQNEGAVVPMDAKLEYNNALDMYKLGKYEDAIACLRTAIRLYPDYIDAYYNLGAILDYLNQSDEAIYVYKQILTRKFDEYEAAYKIAKISISVLDKQTAAEYIAMIPTTSSYFIQAKELMLKHNLEKVSIPEKKETNIPQSSGAYINISSPTGITTDSEGNVYIASFSDNSIIKVTPDNKRIIYFKNAILKGPIAIASDNRNNMYIANYNANNILKLSKNGNVEVFIHNTPKPYSLHIAGDMLFVSCQGSNAVIRKRLY